MHFVDDKHLVAVPHRGNRQPGDNHLADVVDLGVGSSIDLKYIDITSLRYLHTGITVTTGILSRSCNAVQRPRQDTRGCGFTHPTWAGEDESLC